MKTYLDYTLAKVAAKSGEEIWSTDSRRHPNKHACAVMTTEEANEYIRTTPYWLRIWSHWETIRK